MHDTAQPPLSEKAQALLAKFPETVLLRPSGPLFIAFLSLTVAFFSSLGWLFWFTAHEPNLPLNLFLMSYPLTVFCFAMDFVALWLLCDFMRGRMWLRLDVTGFQAFFWFKRKQEDWSEVDDISVTSFGTFNSFVTYSTKEPLTRWNLNRRLLSGKSALPGKGIIFGLRTTDLANLMAAWRKRALMNTKTL